MPTKQQKILLQCTCSLINKLVQSKVLKFSKILKVCLSYMYLQNYFLTITRKLFPWV